MAPNKCFCIAVGSYQASSNEPPSVSLYPHQGVAPPPTAQSNPWHREEREKVRIMDAH